MFFMKRTVRFLNVDIQSITQEELLRSLSKPYEGE